MELLLPMLILLSKRLSLWKEEEGRREGYVYLY
jgi:hypothetical protein